MSVLVSPEDTQTSILLSQGTFSWQGPDSQNEETESGAAEGSLVLHGLTLHVTKVQHVCSHVIIHVDFCTAFMPSVLYSSCRNQCRGVSLTAIKIL